MAAFNELSCLTSLLENFSLIEPGSETSFAPLHNKGGGLDDFGARDNEDATKMLSQIPLEMPGPHTSLSSPVNYSKTPKSEAL